jgi:hypothetical protein
MAFQQLYYTSCRSGLRGYGGYQFNAVTTGVSPVVMREIEERTVYEPPRWLLADPCPEEPEAYPVAFSHGASEATGAAITTHVVFAGEDYSGRPGNYFVHALVTDAPGRDFGTMLPVELWGAALWQSTPAAGPELPELPGPLPRGVIDRAGVEAFLDTHGAGGVLPGLLTAAGLAMTGAKPVLLASQDPAENAWWIAAVCYLLGEQLGHQVTFTTYSHRPGYSRYHLIGALPETLPADAGRSFQLFDPPAGLAPGGGVHPLAALLAETGVMAAPGLWRQAAAFSSGTEDSLDGWLAPVAVAAALLGRRLSAAEADAVAQWLPGSAGWISAELADVALGVALAQPPGGLSGERLLGLLDMARMLPLPARVDELERLLAEHAVTQIARGEPAVALLFTGPQGTEAAQARAVELLRTATPAVALALLGWAAACEVVLPGAELERYGRARLDLGRPAEFVPLLQVSPVIQRGLLTRLAHEPPQVSEALLGGPLAEQLNRDVLAGYPVLTEQWLVLCAARGSIPPMRAFDEVRDVRSAAHREPLLDGTLLRRLWPDGCPPDQLAELLGSVTGEPGPDVADWFLAQIGEVPPREKLTGGWLRLAQALAGHPLLSQLPDADARLIFRAARVRPLLRRARSAVATGDVAIFAELFGVYQAADDDTRHFLDRDLPTLLAGAKPLHLALRGCPEGVAASFCAELERRLAPSRPDVPLAGRVFTALIEPDVTAQPGLAERLEISFEQVREWRRRDLGALARTLEHDADLAQLFQAWRDEHRRGRARRLFGGAPGAPDGRRRGEG